MDIFLREKYGLFATTEQAPWMEDMVSRVQQVLTDMHILGDQHELDAMTLLLSMPGACQQDYHCDFPWNHRVFARNSLEKDGTVPYPVSVLIAFHDKGASLPLMRGETIVFDKLSAAVFRGDCEHAGAEWTRFQRDWNFRVHMYFVTAGKSVSPWKTCKVPRSGRTSRGGNNIQVCPTRPPWMPPPWMKKETLFIIIAQYVAWETRPGRRILGVDRDVFTAAMGP